MTTFKEIAIPGVVLVVGLSATWYTLQGLGAYFEDTGIDEQYVDALITEEGEFVELTTSPQVFEIWSPSRPDSATSDELVEPTQRETSAFDLSTAIHEWTPVDAESFALRWSLDLQLLLDETCVSASARADDPLLSSALESHYGTVGDFIGMDANTAWDALVYAWCPEVHEASAQYEAVLLDLQNAQISLAAADSPALKELVRAYEDGVFAARDAVFEAASRRVSDFQTVRQLLRRE